MMYIPKDGETIDNVDTYTLKSRQSNYTAYELISPNVQDSSEYEPILDVGSEVADENDELFLAVDWIQKRDCIVVMSSTIDNLLKKLEEAGYKMNCTPIGDKPFLSSGKSFRDRAIFEVIVNRMAECATEDKLYLCYNWRKGMNNVIWITNKPNERLQCIGPKGVFFEPE